ncbi:MAG TPA: MFS transporter [Chloroflexota bacterium]|nr:MFS transporter [Chloroflexota bacterium]
MGGGLTPLGHRSFACVWTGALISNIGNWMETVAAGILVTETTHQAGWTGLIAVAGFLPAALLAPVGGALADRLERKRLLIATNLLELALAALLALLAWHAAPAPAALALILFAAGCVGALGFPAYQAILPDLVPREDLLGAIALSSAQWNLGRVVGPALAGAAIYVGGYGWAFAINALTFLAPVAALLAIQLPPPAKTGQAIARHIVEGARFARHNPSVRAAIAAVALFSLLAGPFIALVAAMAITVLHAGPGGAAALVTGQGLGAVTAAFFLSGLAGRFGRGRVLLATMALLPPALILYALAPRIWLAVAAISLLGGLYLSLLSGLSTVVQLCTPASLRGRVLSLHAATLSTLFPIGSICQGTIADHLGLRTTTISAALLLAAVLAVTRRRGWYAGLVTAEGLASGATIPDRATDA